MQETAGHAIEYLCLSMSDRCHAFCGDCRLSGEEEARFDVCAMLVEEFLQVASAAVAFGIKKIELSGAEPLLRPNMVEFIRGLSRLPGPPEVSLSTSGSLLVETAGELKQAGLTRVSVNLDTLRPDRFAALSGSEALSRVLPGLEAASGVGLAARIVMTPRRGVNEDEIVDFARLTLSHPWEVRFSEGPLAGDDEAAWSRDHLPAAAIREELARLGILLPVPPAEGEGPVRVFRYSASRGTVGVIHGASRHVCSECNRFYITADGRIRCCLLSPAALDLKPALHLPSSEKELTKIFRAAAASKAERQRIEPKARRWAGGAAPGIEGLL